MAYKVTTLLMLNMIVGNWLFKNTQEVL